MKCINCANLDIGTTDYRYCRGVNPPSTESRCPAFRAGRPRNLVKRYKRYSKKGE